MPVSLAVRTATHVAAMLRSRTTSETEMSIHSGFDPT
jgi:hypothetical protein